MEYCNCEKCVKCCNRIPGVPKPEEVVKIAEFLHMELKECLEKYFVVGWRENIYIKDMEGKEKSYSMEYVYPAKKGFEGKREDWGYPLLSGECIFLENNLCKINEVKPFECLKTFGCANDNIDYRGQALLEWDKFTKEKKLPLEIVKFIAKAPKCQSVEGLIKNG